MSVTQVLVYSLCVFNVSMMYRHINLVNITPLCLDNKLNYTNSLIVPYQVQCHNNRILLFRTRHDLISQRVWSSLSSLPKQLLGSTDPARKS